MVFRYLSTRYPIHQLRNEMDRLLGGLASRAGEVWSGFERGRPSLAGARPSCSWRCGEASPDGYGRPTATPRRSDQNEAENHDDQQPCPHGGLRLVAPGVRVTGAGAQAMIQPRRPTIEPHATILRHVASSAARGTDQSGLWGADFICLDIASTSSDSCHTLVETVSRRN